MKVLHVVPGDEGHGVVRHGRNVCRAVRRCGTEVVLARSLERSQGADVEADVVHVQFTDALFGPDIASAARAFGSWAGTLAAPLVVTLHDVPGSDPDVARDARRSAGYARVTDAAAAVIVASPHELNPWPAPAHVIPLPVEDLPTPGPVPSWAHDATAGVLGFIYPGKGHARVIAAAAPGSRVVALGGPSRGHEALVRELGSLARARGVDLVVTGPLSDADLHAAARAVTVPVAAYDTQGSSASILTWLAAGRRPLLTSTPYTQALLLEHPDWGTLVTDLEAALSSPPGTWLTEPVCSPDVGQLHLSVYASVL
jgi:hypothetical protein